MKRTPFPEQIWVRVAAKKSSSTSGPNTKSSKNQTKNALVIGPLVEELFLRLPLQDDNSLLF